MSLQPVQPITTGRCRACGRPLRSRESEARGIGPVCARRNENEGRSVFDNELEELTEGWRFDVVCSRISGRPKTNVPRSVVHHSPDGFEWNYPGSGPADLALNILNAFVPPRADGYAAVKCLQGEASRTAMELHQAFKFAHIATMPRQGGQIPAMEVMKWLDNKIAEAGLLPEDQMRIRR